jgi:uncharacterized protein (DUF2342 family)
MKKRVTVLAAAAAAVVITGAAVAQAQPDEARPGGQMDRMHNSEQMREWHDQMPAEARELCDQMHDQMESQMGQMMGQMTGQMHRDGATGLMHGLEE